MQPLSLAALSDLEVHSNGRQESVSDPATLGSLQGCLMWEGRESWGSRRNRTQPSLGETDKIFTVWPWPLTYDPDLQSQASQGQGRPSCHKPRSKVKQFKQESAQRQTVGHTDATKRIIAPATWSIMNHIQ